MDLKLGPRYAFFSGGNASSPEYQYAMSVGKGCISNLSNQLTNTLSEDINGHHLNKIKSYIDFLKGVSISAQNNEINFLKKLNELYDEKYLGTELKSHLIKLLENIDKGNFDYIQFMSVFSDYMNKDEEHYQERIQQYHDNMKVIDTNYQDLKKSAETEEDSKLVVESIISAFHENYHLYKGKAAKYLINPVFDDQGQLKQFQTSVSTLISNRYKSMMNNLMHSAKIESIVISQVSETGVNVGAIISQIRTAAVNWITSLNLKTLIENNGKDLASQFINELETNYTDMMKNISNELINQATALFESKKKHKSYASFEEIALTTGTGLTDLFEKLDSESQKKIINLNPTLLSKLRKQTKELEDTQKAKRAFSSALKTTIKNEFNELGFKMPQGTKEEIRTAINTFTNKHKDILGTTNIKQEIMNGLSVTSSGGTMAEFLGANANKLFGTMSAGGSKSKFKTDISVTITWNDNLNFDFSNENQEQELKSQIENFIPNMMNEMKRLNLKKGSKAEQTDVEVSVKAYLNTMQNIKNLINELETLDKNDEEQRQRLLKQLNDFFLESISVKDYDFYNNELGIHGGSLGGGSLPANVIHNITTMYSMGGISPIDENLLMFGVMNCADGMAATNIKEDLSTYLLGGAAMIMFDDGFTNIETFFSSVKQEFGFGMAPLNLYRLQGRIVPASYIYSNIYNKLCETFKQLEVETSLQTLSTSSCKVTITNKATIADISHTGTRQERWDQTAKNVENKISINFSFMAGLLDIFNKIPEAFNQ